MRTSPIADNIKSAGYHKKAGKDILIEFHGASTPLTHGLYFNRRAEVWCLMRDAMKNGLELPKDPELEADLVGPEYFFSVRDGQDVIQLEKKQDMKARGLSSPDVGDAVAYSFAVKLMPKDNIKFVTVQPSYYSPGSEGAYSWMV